MFYRGGYIQQWNRNMGHGFDECNRAGTNTGWESTCKLSKSWEEKKEEE